MPEDIVIRIIWKIGLADLHVHEHFNRFFDLGSGVHEQIPVLLSVTEATLGFLARTIH